MARAYLDATGDLQIRITPFEAKLYLESLAAIGAAAGDAKKGALIGAGVGAAGGAIYDATR